MTSRDSTLDSAREPVTTTGRPVAPSVHARAVITWLAIFPMVAVGLTVMAPFTQGWHPILRSFVLTAFIVPLAVYLVIPRMLALYARLRARRA